MDGLGVVNPVTAAASQSYLSVQSTALLVKQGWLPLNWMLTLALHYRKPPLGLPAKCDSCSALFTIEHALDCHFGGLVSHRHNEVQDALGDSSSLV